MKLVLLDLFKKEKIKLESLHVIFCSDGYLHGMNRQFLNHDTYTDIITFNLSESRDSVIGELYISVDRVKDNASSLSQRREEELRRVIFHGCLHLCGYKDKLKKDRVLMRQKEEEYLRVYLKRST